MHTCLRGYVPNYIPIHLNTYGPHVHVHNTHMSAYRQTGGQTDKQIHGLTDTHRHTHRRAGERTGGHAYVTGRLRTWNLKD